MVKRVDINAPSGELFADVVSHLASQARSVHTTAAGVKDLGVSGDVVWRDTSGAAKSIRAIDTLVDELQSQAGVTTPSRMNTVASHPPQVSAGDYEDGAYWTQVDAGPPLVEVDRWVARNGQWEQIGLDAGRVVAGKIDAGLVDAVGLAARFITGGLIRTAQSGQRVELTSSGLTQWLVGPDGGEYEALRLSASGVNSFAVVDGSGRFVAQISPDGDASFRSLSVESLSINNSDVADGVTGGGLTDWFTRRSWGVVSLGGRYEDSERHTGRHAVYEVSGVVRLGRLYRVSLSGHRIRCTQANSQVGLRMQYNISQFVDADGGLPVIPRPGADADVLTAVTGNCGPSGEVSLSASKVIQFSDDPSSDRRDDKAYMRVVVSIEASAGQSWLAARDGSGRLESAHELTIEDVGPARPTLAHAINPSGGGSDSGPPPQEQTTTLRALWVASFRGNGSLRGDTSDVMQGESSFARQNGNHRSAVGFGDVAGFLGGARVKKVELYLYCNHTGLGAGGVAQIGTHPALHRPTSMPDGWYRRVAQDFRRGQGRWLDITGMEPQGWSSGAVRGVTLGPADSTSDRYYLRFDGGRSPRLRITYEK